jgi:hypothetical protein
MLLRELERRESVRRQALRLADTGIYARWEEVAHELRLEQRPYVASVLGNPWLRILIDLRCVLAARDGRHRSKAPFGDTRRAA